MKKLIPLVLTLMLSGCFAIDAMLMSKYDSSEYALIASLSSIAEVGNSECSDPVQMKVTAYSLLIKATEFKNYTADIPNNVESIKMSSEIFTMVKGLSDRYNSGDLVSVAYCTSKMTIIERTSKTIQTAIGTKPR